MPRANNNRANDTGERAAARTGRRTLLKLAGAAAVAGALHPLSARQPATATVDLDGALSEDLVLGPGDLARGRFDGTAATGAGVQLLPGRGRGHYTSPVLSGSRPFTHIGLHWTGSGAEALNFELRSAAAGGGWSDWDPVLLEPHVPEGATETFGALVGADRHTRIQFRATFSPDALLQATTLTLIDAGDGSSPSVTSTVGTASLPELDRTVITREGWDADEDLRFHDGNEIWPRMFVPAKKVVVHHTATSNNYTDAKAEVRAIYRYHAVTLGWGDIGYNALIDHDGIVYEGRYSRDGKTLAQDVVAGHAASHNYGSLGIALIGTFTQRGEGSRPGLDEIPDPMWETLLELVTWECDRHHLDPEEATNFLRWDLAWNDGLPNIAGHRDCQSTICPGGVVFSRLPELRDEVAERLERRALPELQLSEPEVEDRTASLNEAKELLYRWLPDTGGFLYLLEGWKPDPNDPKTPIEDILYLSGYSGENGDEERDWHVFDGTEPEITFEDAFDKDDDFPNPVPGRYTFHVRAVDDAGSSFQRTHTLLVTGEPADPPATGSIVGIVEDEEGARIQGALVAVGGTSLSDTTNSSGEYTIADVPEGTYDVTASADGFESQTLSTAVEPDQTATLDFALVAESGDDDDDDAKLVLSATGYKVRGLQKADLTWSGGTPSESVEISRDGTLIHTASNDTSGGGAFTDHIDERGSGSYTYLLREPGTDVESDPVTVTF